MPTSCPRALTTGPPEELVAYLRDLESRYPGLEHINLSTPMGTPLAIMEEQFRWIAQAVMPAFQPRAASGSSR